MDERMPGGHGQMPRGGEPPAAAPPPGGPPAPGGDNPLRAKIEAEIARLPEADGGAYDRKHVERLAEAVKDVSAKLLGKPIEVVIPEGDLSRLPVELMFPLLVLLMMGGEAYAIDVATLVDDKTLRMLLAKLTKLGQDKKVAAAVRAEMEPKKEDAEEVPKGPPPPMSDKMRKYAPPM